MIAIELSDRLQAIEDERALLLADIMSGNVPPMLMGRAHSAYFNIQLEIESLRWQLHDTDDFEANITMPMSIYSSDGALPDDTIEIQRNHGKRIHALPDEE